MPVIEEVAYTGGWASYRKTKVNGLQQTELRPDPLLPTIEVGEIENGMCRWPTTLTHWCGRPCGHNLYCQDHARRAYKKGGTDEVRDN